MGDGNIWPPTLAKLPKLPKHAPRIPIPTSECEFCSMLQKKTGIGMGDEGGRGGRTGRMPRTAMRVQVARASCCNKVVICNVCVDYHRCDDYR